MAPTPIETLDAAAASPMLAPRHVVNAHLAAMNADVMYHIGLTWDGEDRLKLAQLFGDTKFFVTGGSPDRITNFAKDVATALDIETPYGYSISPIGSTARYVVYKVGPVLTASHGMGVPSVSILLHEVTKLLEYAGAHDCTYIRMGTSGGVGVEPGTVVISTEGVNHEMEAVDEVAVLGKIVRRSAIFSADVAADIAKAAEAEGVPFATGKTLTCNDFYEGQGRLDGAICEYTAEDKFAFLKVAADAGVKNIEMEAKGFAGFCHKLHIPVACVCVTLLNRLLGDQVLSSHETLVGYEQRPAAVLLRFIKARIAAGN